jgi:alpha-beta hydrolase superfamily lysophospholipase
MPGPPTEAAQAATDAFVMPDGMRLPYRAWLPDGEPWAVMLALHGMNDSRNAWEIPAPDFAQAGVAVFSPDQRGFGNTTVRGYWPGTQALVDDAREMATLLHARYPQARLILAGESMGAAELMCLATARDPPANATYVLIAPLTVHDTRFDAVEGLVDLMDAAADAAPRFNAPSLFLYGGKDELIPPDAMARVWRALPRGPVRAFYPEGYHLLPRDLGRAAPIGDIVAWLQSPTAPLPSGAQAAATAWLAQQP